MTSPAREQHIPAASLQELIALYARIAVALDQANRIDARIKQGAAQVHDLAQTATQRHGATLARDLPRITNIPAALAYGRALRDRARTQRVLQTQHHRHWNALADQQQE